MHYCGITGAEFQFVSRDIERCKRVIDQAMGDNTALTVNE